MDRKRTETRAPAPLFSIKKPRMAVFAQSSNLHLDKFQEQPLSDFKPRHPISTSSLQRQMNSVSYRPLQTQLTQSLTAGYPTGNSQSSMKTGQQFTPQVQESPCRGGTSARMPLFQQRQTVSSFQPRSGTGGKNPPLRYPPSTRTQFPEQAPARLNALPLMESQDYNSRSNFPRGFNCRNKSGQVKDATEAWKSTGVEEDGAVTFALERNKPDTSLRVLTTTIDGMKHWANLRDKPPLLFEVFGTVNSALSGDSTTDAVQFLLRDSQATVSCIFHQIDRTLQRLTRGQWYRCIGRYNANTGSYLRCVSIRPIREAEMKHMKMLIAASDNAMQALVQKTREI